MATMFKVWNGNPYGMSVTVSSIAEADELLKQDYDDFKIWLVDMGGYLTLDGDMYCDWKEYKELMFDRPSPVPAIKSLDEWRAWQDSPYGRSIVNRDRIRAANREAGIG